MSAEEQQISIISTTEEVLNEQPEDDEQQRVAYHEDDDVQNLPEEVHQDSYQAVASSSTAESSNLTLRDDNLEQNPVIPRRKNSISNSKPSDRYTFSFSADLIAQFDNYRAHMRESIRQELTTQKIEEEPENDDEEIFSVHQANHEPIESNLQEISTRDRSTDNAQKSVLPTKSSKQKRKKFGIPFLRGKSNRNAPATTTATSSTLSSAQRTTTTSELTDNEKSNSSRAKKYFLKIYKLFRK